MKGKEILKKVEKFNKLADELGQQKITAIFSSEYCVKNFYNYEDFYNFIDEQYIEKYKKLILEDEWYKSLNDYYSYDLKVKGQIEVLQLYICNRYLRR